MEPLPALIITMVLASLLIARLSLQPFLSLVVSAMAFGLLCGMGQNTMNYISRGLGDVFSTLAIVIFCGAVIAEYLRQAGAAERIVHDLHLISRGRNLLVCGLSGFLLSLPAACCVTSYLILEPLVSALGRERGLSRRFQFTTAVASVVSFVLVYPSPVVTAVAGSLAISPEETLRRAIPLSLLLLGGALLILGRLPPVSVKGEEGKDEPSKEAMATRWMAWAPVLLPIGLILTGPVNPIREMELLVEPNGALLLGALLGLALGWKARQEMLSTASRRGGVILLDLCGAGALGHVVAESRLGDALFAALGGSPSVLLPFALTALIQLALGSRVVTVLVAAQILKSYPMDPTTLLLLICSGSMVLSYVTDPYFWLIKDTTGASMREMVMGYTLPLTLLGLVVMVVLALLQL